MEGALAKTCDEVFATLIAQGTTADELHAAVCKQVSPWHWVLVYDAVLLR